MPDARDLHKLLADAQVDRRRTDDEVRLIAEDYSRTLKEPPNDGVDIDFSRRMIGVTADNVDKHPRPIMVKEAKKIAR